MSVEVVKLFMTFAVQILLALCDEDILATYLMNKSLT